MGTSKISESCIGTMNLIEEEPENEEEDDSKAELWRGSTLQGDNTIN